MNYQQKKFTMITRTTKVQTLVNTGEYAQRISSNRTFDINPNQTSQPAPHINPMSTHHSLS